MAAKDLIIRARAYQALGTLSGVDALIDVLITAISDAIETYCRRSFYSRTVEELHDGGDLVQLREYPVQSIAWVRHSPQTVLEVTNNSTGTNQRATVQVTSTGLTLTRVASGISSSDSSVTWAGNATLQAVTTAVNALGNGWSATVKGSSTGDYGLWPSADLHIPPRIGDGLQSQGAMNARGRPAQLRMHVEELYAYEWTPQGKLIPSPDTLLWFLDSSYLLGWPLGVNHYRVKYTAGYTTIPEAVQEACARWVAHVYRQTTTAANLASESLAINAGNATSAAYFRTGGLPFEVAALLAPFRRHTV